MNQTITGIELINVFEKSCNKSHKLFIPDSPRQDAVADALVKHYDSELLIKAIEQYVKSKPGPFLLFDFAVDSRSFIDNVKKEQASINKFRDLVKETQQRMAGE